MDFKKFLSSYSGIRQENLFYRVICVVLLVANLLLGVAVMSRNEVVVLVPPLLKEETKISLKKADQKYQESWALFFHYCWATLRRGTSNLSRLRLKNIWRRLSIRT